MWSGRRDASMKDMRDVRQISGMRASDHDRQEVVDRLRAALDDGRLTLEEYLDRMGHAYQAVTYADLTPLHGDLPAASRPVSAAAGPAAPPAPAVPVAPGPVGRGFPCAAFGRLPAPLRVLWTIWLMAVSINVVIWVLVSVTTASLIYPWPLWVAGPWGAWLFAISLAAAAARRRPRSR
jgi:hypothetical protein